MTVFDSILYSLQKAFGWKLTAVPIWILGLTIILCTHSDNKTADTIINLMWFVLLFPIIILPTKRKDGN